MTSVDTSVITTEVSGHPENLNAGSYWKQKAIGMLAVDLVEIAYLGPVPLSHSVQHCASQKPIPESTFDFDFDVPTTAVHCMPSI